MIHKQNPSTLSSGAVDCAVICVGSKLALIGDRKQRGERMCSYAAETRFGRNGRQRKSSPERGGNDLLWDCLLLVSYHIGTLKSSKLVVNYGKIVVFRGFRG